VSPLILNETGPGWRCLDPIPDSGQWAVAANRTTAALTMQQMAWAVNRAVRMRQVVELACAIISQSQERDYPASLSLIRQYVTRHFRFVRDPSQIELLRRPEYLLQRIQSRGLVCGDCDDAAQLVATLGKAVGFPAEFHAIGFRPGARPSHVYTVLRLPDGCPVEFDVTRPERFRVNPPPVMCRLVRRV
jgi:transglutaminase-like putative cysteine protease